jgi:hypothetical protein
MTIVQTLLASYGGAAGIGPVIVSAWGAGGAGGNVNSSGDGEDAGPGGNGGFVEFRIEGLLGTETIYAYPGGGGSAFTDIDNGDAGGGGAATVVYITDGVSTDYLCVVGAGGGGGGVGSDPDNFDATAGAAGGAAGGNGDDAEDVGRGAIGGHGGTQSTGGVNPSFSIANPPSKGTYAQDGGVGLQRDSDTEPTGQAGAGGVIGHSFGGAGGEGGLEEGNEGGGGGGGGGWFGGAGGSGDLGGNDAGAGGGGGSTNLNTSPSGFSYLTITQISTSAGTASPTVQYDGSASTQSAGSTNEFSVSVGGQAGRGGQTNGQAGLSGSNGRVAVGLEGGTATINTTSTSGASSLASAL